MWRRSLELHITVKVAVIIQGHQSLAISTRVDQTLHAHIVFMKVACLAPVAACDDCTYQKDEDEVDRTVPDEEQGSDHQFIVVVPLPDGGPWEGIVEDKANLPEPRALHQQEVGARQWAQQVVSVLHLHGNCHSICDDSVNQECVQQDVQLRAAMQVVLKQQPLHHEGKNIAHIVDIWGQWSAVKHQNVNHTCHPKTEKHCCMLGVA